MGVPGVRQLDAKLLQYAHHPLEAPLGRIILGDAVLVVKGRVWPVVNEAFGVVLDASAAVVGDQGHSGTVTSTLPILPELEERHDIGFNLRLCRLDVECLVAALHCCATEVRDERLLKLILELREGLVGVDVAIVGVGLSVWILSEETFVEHCADIHVAFPTNIDAVAELTLHEDQCLLRL